MSQKLTVLDTAEPMLFISRFTGYCLFTIDRKTWQSRVTKTELLPMFLTVWISLGLNCIYWKSFIGVEAKVNTISRISLPILVYTDYSINTASILWIFFNRCKIAKFLQQIQQIDEELMEMGQFVDYEAQRKCVIKSLAVTLTAVTAMIVSNFLVLMLTDFVSEKLFSAIIFWTVLSTVIQVHHYIATAYAIRSRVLQLQNRLLSSTSNIQKVSKVHFQVTELIPIFNHIFSPVILMYFANGFAWTCISIFDIVTYPAAIWTASIAPVVLVIGHCLLEIGIVISVIFAVESVKKEILKIGKICYKILNDFGGNERRKEDVVKLLNQVTGLEVKFTGGLVDIDWKLMFQFITACLMYFVILVQFHGNLN